MTDYREVKKRHFSKIPLVHAVAWIVGSVIVVLGVAHFFLQDYKKKQMRFLYDPQFRLTRIVQTGPQRQALSTLCLAEIMGLSFDRPIATSVFDVVRAEKCLMASPVIEKAHLALEKPNTLHVDYKTRQAICWLYDYVNLGLDEKGYPFPVIPFFSPKNLPEIYLGLFAASSPPQPLVWNEPIRDERLDLALTILRLFSSKEYSGLFTLRRIDTSLSFAESCGERQIILSIEEMCKKKIGEREVHIVQPLFLRLSSKNLGQELGNYLSLRQKLWEGVDFRELATSESETILHSRTIDLRIDGLAFIQ